MADELKPCPFCGGEVEIDDSDMFKCLDCGMIVRFPASPRQRKNAAHGLILNNSDPIWHIAEWNTRSQDETQHTHCCPCGARRTCDMVPHVEDDDSIWVVNCSECGDAIFARGGDHRCNYCPNCGARVVE